MSANNISRLRPFNYTGYWTILYLNSENPYLKVHYVNGIINGLVIHFNMDGNITYKKYIIR